MKKIYTLTFLLLFICNTLYAQKKPTFEDSLSRKTFLSLSVTGGLIIPLGEFGSTFNNAFDAGVEISLHPIPHYAFYFNVHYDFLNFKDLTYQGNAGLLELGVGGRKYLGRAPQLFFVEAGVGDYLYHNTVTIPGTAGNDRGGFGIKAGLGANMPLSPRILLLVKTDFHVIFSSGTKTYFPGIYGGLRFIL